MDGVISGDGVAVTRRVKNIKMLSEGLRMKQGASFYVEPTLNQYTIGLALVLVGADEVEMRFEFEREMDLETVTANRFVNLDSFAGMSDLGEIMTDVITKVVVEEGEIEIESGGSTLNVYFRLREYHEMLEIDREIAEEYVRFPTARDILL